MHTRSALVSDRQPAKPMQPGKRSFHDPAGAAKSTAMGDAAVGQLRENPSPMERVSMRLRGIAAVALNQLGFAERRSATAAERRHRVDERQQLGEIVAIGGGQRRDERNPVRVGENMMLRPGLAAIGRVRSSFFPPRTARSEELSTTARARSSWPRRRNSVSNTVCNRLQTPACCQRTSRRQHVLPEPQPISRGSMFHGKPLRSTKRIPVRTARSGSGRRPAYCRFRRRRFGKRGSIRAHNASSMRAWDIADRLAVGQATVPSLQSQYKRSVS